MEQLVSKVGNELELASNLAKRRTKIVQKIKQLHPEIADDIWGAVGAAQVDIGDRVG